MDCRNLDKHTPSHLWRSVVEIIPSYSMGWCHITLETESTAAYLVATLPQQRNVLAYLTAACEAPWEV